jgi:2-polyprenyl-3-methyl-5-hydroxy-6-metoxy-1,4-benzoquinol methylase
VTDLPPRLLVLVVAYNAEETLEWVLGRIPETVLASFRSEILVIDDASSDRTFQLGGRYRRRFPDVPLRVLRNTANQGYGGNQKIGYTYAIAEGFDYVALIHGDGQYAPEELPRLLEPLVSGRADAVYGSRMMVRGAARRGGMPLYKFVGNRVLTRVQNALLRSSMSEFHSGYRIYSVAALRGIRYQLDSDGFAFDTEVTLQLLNAGARILELPIPTYYGNEISRVNGLAYATDVIHATAANALHRSGVLQQRRFDPLVEPDGLKLGYPSTHSWVLEMVPPGASVMDIGARDTRLAERLAARAGRVCVVLAKEAADTADPRLHVHVQDLDEPLTFDTGPYEYLLLLDVVQRLRSPEDFLDRLRAQFGAEPKQLVLSTANVAFVAQRLMLAGGQFTLRTTRHLLRDAGFRIVQVRGVPAPFPKALGDHRLSRWLVAANQALIRVSTSLFAYQFLIRAESTPNLDFRLRSTRASEQP